jgi:hypothetical protein
VGPVGDLRALARRAGREHGGAVSAEVAPAVPVLPAGADRRPAGAFRAATDPTEGVPVLDALALPESRVGVGPRRHGTPGAGVRARIRVVASSIPGASGANRSKVVGLFWSCSSPVGVGSERSG